MSSGSYLLPPPEGSRHLGTLCLFQNPWLCLTQTHTHTHTHTHMYTHTHTHTYVYSHTHKNLCFSASKATSQQQKWTAMLGFAHKKLNVPFHLLIILLLFSPFIFLFILKLSLSLSLSLSQIGRASC